MNRAVNRDRLIARLGRARAGGVRGDADLNPGMAVAGPLTTAAVLAPLVAHGQGMTVLLTRRTDHLVHHPGQISFPGGRVEPGDDGPETTALREAEEEIGLSPDKVDVIGRLDEYLTRTGFRVTPVVALLQPPLALSPDPLEVAEVFEVPLDFVLEPANYRRDYRVHEGRRRWFHAIPYDRHYIWGATAGMLVNLRQHLAEERELRPDPLHPAP